MRVVRRGEGRPMPWKNGVGTTWQVAVWPEGAGLDDFEWRITQAEVAQDGPFSAFPGVDRSLMLLGPAGDGHDEGKGTTGAPAMELDFGAGQVLMTPASAPVSFPGEAAVTARLPGGPVRDLNVMSRRGHVSHHLTMLRGGRPAPEGTIAMIGCATPVHAGEVALAPGDVLLGWSAPLDGLRAEHATIIVTMREVRP